MHIQLPTGEFTAPKEITPEIRLENPYENIRGAKNIVFDLGGVIIDLKRELAVARLQALGLKEADRMLGLYRQEEPFLGLETGHTTVGIFFDHIRSLCPGASDTDITDAFNAFLVALPPARLQRLRELRNAGYRLFVLSNTNPLMFHSWIADAFRQEGLTIHDYFDGVVASFEELTCKPDVELFSRVLTRYGLEGKETVMLDDSAANCEAARQAGMLAVKVGTSPDSDMLYITSCLLRN